MLAAAEAGEAISELVDDSDDEAEDASEESASDGSLDTSSEEAPAEDDSSDDVDYESMTVAELKGLLKEAGKPVSGKKAELIERLKE